MGVPTMRVPFLGLDRRFERHRSELLAIAERTWSTGRVLQGDEVAELEGKLAELCGRTHGVAVGSCTDALSFALMIAGVGPGDEVLVTALSFFASVSPILRVGATPRFVDIEDPFYMMDLAQLEDGVTDRSRAVLAVHLFGQTLPMAELEGFAAKHGLALVEDGAQGLGSGDGDRPVGSMGLISTTSFDPTKVVGAQGSGGALLTDDDATATQARLLRYHGRNPKSRRYERLGFNSQLPSAQAAMLTYQLALLPEWTAQRQLVADLYLAGLGDVDEVRLPRQRPGSAHNWHKFVIRTSDRDGLRQSLREAGIDTAVHYPRVLCDEPVVAQLGLPPVEVPVARAAAAEVLSLPIYPELELGEAQAVVDAIKGHFAGRAMGR